MPKIQKFTLNAMVVAKEIYRGYQHQTTPVGVVVEEGVRKSLKGFLEEFLEDTGCPKDSFLRIDTFIRDDSLDIIEINVECQEGWGIALNLLRASGTTLAAESVARLPREIISYDESYIPEFLVAQTELGLLGSEMGLVTTKDRPNVPIRSSFDDKLYLAVFERKWSERSKSGACITVPPLYFKDKTAWEEIPEDVVFKFCLKYGEWSQKARCSVAARAEIGRGKFMRRCYEASGAVAQERILPYRTQDGSVTQAIIMCAGAEPVTGYLQVAPPDTFVINDRSARKGPLVFIR